MDASRADSARLARPSARRRTAAAQGRGGRGAGDRPGSVRCTEERHLFAAGRLRLPPRHRVAASGLKTSGDVARYIRSRLLWACVMVDFLITHTLPGDPVDVLVGDFPAPPEYVTQVRHEFGLDQPLSTQLWRYVVNLAQGNLGFSFANRQPVLALILQRAGATLLLMVPALILASVLGVLIAVRAARRAGSAMDSFLTGVGLVGYSMPVFWLAQMLIVVFAVDLGWLPAQGMLSLRSSGTGLGMVADYAKHWLLPGFCVTIYYLAVVAR